MESIRTGNNLVRVALCLVLFFWVHGGCQTPIHQLPASRGEYLYRLGKYKDAARVLEREVGFRPSASTFYLLGCTYARMAETEENAELQRRAEEAFLACLRRNPNYAGAYYQLTTLLVRQGRIQEARDLLEGWAALNPAAVEPRIQLARLSYLVGELPAAEDRLIEALTQDPKNRRTLAALEMIRDRRVNLAQRDRLPADLFGMDPTAPISGGVSPSDSSRFSPPTSAAGIR
jgi:tetratricopeptide (TPR) repeat protein